MSRAHEMQDLMLRWERSSLTQRAFAEREGMTYSAFQYWRRRLLREPLETAPVERAAPLQLSAVRIIPDIAASAHAGRSASFELRTSAGLTLSVPPGFDEVALRRLLDVLSAC